MQDIEPSQEERFAVESLLEIENSNDQAEHSFDWNNIQKNDKKNKLASTSYNFVQINKKLNPENLDQNNFINRERLLNLQRFRRARSLFDPMKIFKMGTRELLYDNSQNSPKASDSKSRRIIHKHPDQVRDLNFKSGHPTRSSFYKKDDLNQTSFSEMRHKSNEFINGESVIIQVQSYEENFNRREVEYLMSKTLGPRTFRSHMSFPKKDDEFGVSLLEIKSQDMKLKKENDHELKQVNKSGLNGKISSKMRFTAYVNKKAAEKDLSGRGNEQSQSLDMKNTKVNKEIAISLRLLLNNLKSKTYTQRKSDNIRSELSKYQINVSKIFDRESVFKNYEEEEFKNEKKKRTSKSKHQNELFKAAVPDKLVKHESQKIGSRQQQVNDMIRVTSPRRYYQQKSAKKNMEENQMRIFNIKKLA